MGAFKSISAVRVSKMYGRSGPLWQRNYYEHVIRNEDELVRVRDYIASNPAGWADDEENPHRAGTPSPARRRPGSVDAPPAAG